MRKVNKDFKYSKKKYGKSYMLLMNTSSHRNIWKQTVIHYSVSEDKQMQVAT